MGEKLHTIVCREHQWALTRGQPKTGRCPWCRIAELEAECESWQIIADMEAKHRAKAERERDEARAKCEVSLGVTPGIAELEEDLDQARKKLKRHYDRNTRLRKERTKLREDLCDMRADRDSEKRWADDYKKERDAARALMKGAVETARRLQAQLDLAVQEGEPAEGPQVE
jgi:beta-phosphoglucomutase-like phosphatase (HAD superfamily)